jgi:hypothetical protein
MGDLSDYEKARLENIRRNNAFLEQLGIPTRVKPSTHDDPDKLTESQPLKKQRNLPERQKSATITPIRSSPRLQKLVDKEDTKKEDLNGKDHDDVVDEVDYDSMPFDSNELDDFEFQVFVELKAWRLKKSRELELEPYKIAQNRTLAELVRRKRNTPDWAGPDLSPSDISKSILECWGIGPAKAHPEGFGWELNNVINSSTQLMSELSKSRQQVAVSPILDDSNKS